MIAPLDKAIQLLLQPGDLSLQRDVSVIQSSDALYFERLDLCNAHCFHAGGIGAHLIGKHLFDFLRDEAALCSGLISVILRSIPFERDAF